MSAPIYSLVTGSAPIVVSLPHVGTQIPESLRAGLVPRALAMEDTDWHLSTLYAFAIPLGASVIAATHSRYVIDLNRPPDDMPMYPGAANTELCPTKSFTGEPLYAPGHAPDAAEIARRRALYWQPYHDALRSELDRVRAVHGFVVHWDGHSIRSQIPWLFEGTLPDLNVGTAVGASCGPQVTSAVMDVLRHQSEFSSVLNGRFKGGYTTRHYGRPSDGYHTIQMEMAQCCYMEEQAPYRYDAMKAERVIPLLQTLLLAAVRSASAAGVRT